MCRHLRKHSAFTLIELLVTVTIIVILIALLIPALAGAKTSANNATCLANCRSLGQAGINFASAHQGYFQPVSNDDAIGHTESGWVTAADPNHSRWAYSSTDSNAHALDWVTALFPYLDSSSSTGDTMDNMQSTTTYTYSKYNGITYSTAKSEPGLPDWTKVLRCPADYWMNDPMPGYRIINDVQAVRGYDGAADNYYPVSYGVNADLCGLSVGTNMNAVTAIGTGVFNGYPATGTTQAIVVAGTPATTYPPMNTQKFTVNQASDTLLYADCGTRADFSPANILDNNSCLYYTTNGAQGNVPKANAMTLDGIAYPSGTTTTCPWLANRIPWNGNVNYFYNGGTWTTSDGAGKVKYSYPRHADAINIAFVDGHAETVHRAQWTRVRISPW